PCPGPAVCSSSRLTSPPWHRGPRFRPRSAASSTSSARVPNRAARSSDSSSITSKTSTAPCGTCGPCAMTCPEHWRRRGPPPAGARTSPSARSSSTPPTRSSWPAVADLRDSEESADGVLELLAADLADSRVEHRSVRRDEHGGRHAHHAELHGQGAAGIEPRRVADAGLVQEGQGRIPVVLAGDPEERDPITERAVHLLEGRHLPAAGDAPGRPEVHH